MASANPPVKGAAFAFETALIAQADTDIFKTGPTLVAGDVRVVQDGVLLGNITTLPTAVTNCTNLITVSLSAAEMNADRIAVLFHDAAGDEWQDQEIMIFTSAQTFDATDIIADDVKATVNHVTYGNSALATLIGDVPTAGENADAVLDEAKGAHTGLIAKALPDVAVGVSGGLPTLNINLCVQAQNSAGEDIQTALINDMIEFYALGGGYYRFKARAMDRVVRDALKLAPTAGDPAAGSVDKHLDDILATMALEATLTAMKGAGWTDETLVAIDVLLDAIKAKTDLLAAAGVTVSSPASATGDVTVYQGDDYHNTDGRAIEWSNAAGTWPDLTSATVVFGVRAPNGSSFTATGSVVTPTGAGQKVRVELTATQTALLVDWPTPSELRVRATLASGRKVTLVDAELEAIVDIIG